MSAQVFISYAAADSRQSSMTRIQELLSAEELSCFLYQNDARLGKRVTETVIDTIRHCEVFVVLLSKDAMDSTWVPFEVGVAMAYGKDIVPFILGEDVHVPAYLGDFLSIRDPQTLCENVLAIIQGGGKPNYQHDFILVVGGANEECILERSSNFTRGEKHEVVPISLLGGSGVNHTIRLLKAGVPALPLLAVGDDEVGRSIRRAILEAASGMPFEREVSWFVNRDDFFVPGLKTPRSTIVVDPETRTIFKERTEDPELFAAHLERRMKQMDSGIAAQIAAVMIGHIHADATPTSSAVDGTCTGRVIKEFHDGNRILYANFGESQYRHGASFWRPVLDKLTVLQLNLNEMRCFLSHNRKRPSLRTIVDKLRLRPFTSVITLDKFGGICVPGQSDPDEVVLAWPFELKRVVDTTGAGDAFGAGLVSSWPRKETSTGAIMDAAGEGRKWAAYACLHLGGASECPSDAELSKFAISIKKGGGHSIGKKTIEETGEIFRILDKAY